MSDHTPGPWMLHMAWSDEEQCYCLHVEDEKVATKADFALMKRAPEMHAEIAKLREALEPFAKAAENFDGMNVKNTEEWFAYAGQASADGHSGSITVGDLRRARAALKETGGDSD
jgi:hypothetical protein